MEEKTYHSNGCLWGGINEPCPNCGSKVADYDWVEVGGRHGYICRTCFEAMSDMASDRLEEIDNWGDY